MFPRGHECVICDIFEPPCPCFVLTFPNIYLYFRKHSMNYYKIFLCSTFVVTYALWLLTADKIIYEDHILIATPIEFEQ